MPLTANNSVSYDEAIWTAIGFIPEGKVATYGQVAEIAGFPRTARAVGRVLSKLPKDTLIPWFRVINAKGEISFPIGSSRYDAQKQRLQDEGVVVLNGKINLKSYRWEI
ncbi:MGMT family protein [Neptunomonas sp.]|uniref:MGMT family protein n=1 Tax=Neptunomonas sp. TaxID=1971898 RepID=UPI0025EBD4BC|nr:MGMT family protein [Neptunomonas sp.]